ncbi:hypothetical protein [Mesorhizobium sp. RIZ17]|jgi:uncharacterized protein (DUF2267 family)|uniref:Uncharacterized protein n=1 Tax=Mesorhizobium humile TaxID=3072313 RepID=A0ABU4YSG4_9HYPH|nr:hypothetical protein [Mesorhizobium sp. VK2B]
MTHSVSHASIQHAADQAQQWVNELARDLSWNEQSAFRLLEAVLHTLRDWLSRKSLRQLWPEN